MEATIFAVHGFIRRSKDLQRVGGGGGAERRRRNHQVPGVELSGG